MAQEIERKFLLKNDSWRKGTRGVLYQQGYLSTEKNSTVRVRTVEDKGYLTIKGPQTGYTRTEYEYEIPLEDARTMLKQLCKAPLIKKRRYTLPWKGFTWKIDEFYEENQGLIIAEIELTHENQSIDLPDWTGKEVTGNPQYFNANLVKSPFSTWK